MDFILRLLQAVVVILYISIFARAVMSWFPVSPSNPIYVFVYQVTEPILAPLRRYIPRIGMIDITPMVAIIVLVVIQALISSALN